MDRTYSNVTEEHTLVTKVVTCATKPWTGRGYIIGIFFYAMKNGLFTV